MRIAAESAEAAKLSAKAVVGVELPILMIHGIELTAGVGELLAQVVKITLKNYGRNAAFLRAACSEILIADRFPDGTDLPFVPVPDAHVIMPGETYTMDAAHLSCPRPSDAEVEDMRNGKSGLWVYGGITYRDFLDNRETFTFMRRFNPMPGLSSRDAWQEHRNSLD